MVGTCRKRSISAPELETTVHERWEQKLAKDIRKQQKIFYHPHVYVKNVGSCNFLCLFPCSLTYLMFPCSLRFFCFVPVFPLPNFPCSLVPQKPLGDPRCFGAFFLNSQYVCPFPHSNFCKCCPPSISRKSYLLCVDNKKELTSSACSDPKHLLGQGVAFCAWYKQNLLRGRQEHVRSSPPSSHLP